MTILIVCDNCGVEKKQYLFPRSNGKSKQPCRACVEKTRLPKKRDKIREKKSAGLRIQDWLTAGILKSPPKLKR